MTCHLKYRSVLCQSGGKVVRKEKLEPQLPSPIAMWRLNGTSLPVLGTKGQSEKYVADGHGYVAEHCTVAAVPCFNPFNGFLMLLGWEPLSRPWVTLSDLACPDLHHKAACWTVLLSPSPPFPWPCLRSSVLLVSLCLSFKIQLFTMLWVDFSPYPATCHKQYWSYNSQCL